MIKIGITGSIASGKTTAGKIVSKKRGPLFSADIVVKSLYKKLKFRKLVAKKLDFNLDKNFKESIKRKILSKKKNLKVLEKIIHPRVRKEMFAFIKKNKGKKFLFLEIPLLIESKLMNNFDLIIFIKSKKKNRLKRYLSKGGDTKLFSFLNNQQLKESKKMKFADYIIVNNKSLIFLRKRLLNIINKYG